MRLLLKTNRYFASIPSWATVDPWSLSGSKPHTVSQMLDGKVFASSKTIPVVDPLNG